MFFSFPLSCGETLKGGAEKRRPSTLPPSGHDDQKLQGLYSISIRKERKPPAPG